MSRKNGDDDGKDIGNIISFPSGKSIIPNPSDIGADYVVRTINNSNYSAEEPIDAIDLAKEFEDRENYVSKQKLVEATNKNTPIPEIIDIVLREMAEELSHLKWERRKASQEGRSTVNHTVSRITMLRNLSDILIKKKESSVSEKLDFKSPRFRKVLELWMEFVYNCMVKSGIGEPEIEVVFNQMKNDMLGWESKVSDEVLSWLAGKKLRRVSFLEQ